MDASGQYQLIVFAGLASILPGFVACYSFLQKFATKADLEVLDKKLSNENKLLNAASEKRFTDNQERVKAMESRVSTELLHLENRLSRDIGENRGNNEHRFGEIGSKLDGLTTAMQLYTNETSRSAGVVEGKLGLIEKLMHLPTQKS